MGFPFAAVTASRARALGASAPAASSLLTGLAGYWKLGEAAGATRADSSGNGLTLADHNTVGQAAGVGAETGNAASFVAASSHYLSHVDTAALRITGDTTLSVWCYIDGAPADTNGIIGKWDGPAVEYTVWYNPADSKFVFFNGTTYVKATLPSPAITETWYHVVAWWDDVANEASIQVSGGAVYTASWVEGINQSTGAFVVGSVLPATLFWNGRIDALGKWDRILSAPERAALYNGGSGLEYPFN